jgi:succinyl-diaminopimelate desuccinylase
MLEADDLAELLKRLIRADSPDPPGDERRVATVVAEQLARRGFAPAIEEFAPARFNVVARLEGAGDRPALVFSAHMDTLPAAGGAWTHPPFAGADDGVHVYGRGACDMKSGLAAMIAAAATLRAEGARLAGDVVLAFTGGESSNCLGARRLAATRALAGAGALLVSEPSSLEVLVAHKAALWLRATAHGRAGHLSAGDGGGANAIEMMTRALAGLATALPDDRHPLLGGASLSIGRIDGGGVINLTPERCVADLDVRLLPAHDPAAVEAALAARLGSGFGLERLDFKPAVETAADGAFAACAREAVRAVRGHAAAPGGAAYFTDASVLAHAFGLPTVIVGPGRLGDSGAVDERVAVADMVTAAAIYRAVARAWLG